MNILIKHSRRAKTRKTNIILHAAIDLFLILVIVFNTGCTPQVRVPDAPSTQAASVANNPTPTPSPILAKDTASPTTPPTTSPTTSPSPVPTNTPLPQFSLTFVAVADASLKQSDPSTNYGGKPSLQVDNGKAANESIIEFKVIGISGTVQSALLRLYATKNGSQDGPAVYATTATWSEKEITWDQRPTLAQEALDNKQEIATESWVEYNVTSAVQGNGTLSFVLVADSGDAIGFSSREGIHSPELAVTFTSDVTPTTAPTPLSSNESVTFVGAGDISMCGNDNDELTAELLDNIPGTVFTLGDNAYDDGEYRQFVDCYAPTWGRYKDRTRPIPGNHDYHTADAAGYFQYFDNVAPYYAYNLGSWRIYALNSEIDTSETSPEVSWLQVDLATHPSQCVLAYWHEPRWSSGSTHGSSEHEQVLWQILYQAGAELVLNGHEHSYERFMPMNAEGKLDPFGMREFVVGTGGGVLYPFGTPLETSEVRNNTTYGVLKLTLHPTSYDWEFIPVAGSTFTDSGSTSCH